MRMRPTLACASIVLLVWIHSADLGNAAAAGESANELSFTLEADGQLVVAGVLPQGLSAEELMTVLPEAQLGGIDHGMAGPPAEWGRAVEALAIVLPRFRTARARLEDGALAIEGELKRGLSAAGARAALRAALGAGWRLDLDLVEAAPLAEIVLARRGEGGTVSGLLPMGLAPTEALALLDGAVVDRGLAGGGDGDAQAWSAILSALGDVLDLFESAMVRVSAGEVSITGTLRPGYPRASVADWLGARMPEGWSARVAAEETAPSEGDRRIDLATGQRESFRSGHWLPEVDFPVSAERCAAETDTVMGQEGLPFAADEARIEDEGLALINRLAAIAIRCLNSSRLELAIGGHTDSVGNDAKNERLSQARAEAIRAVLLDRGVRPDAVSARGYGESRPVASNNTPEGRAQNRRITFEWIDPAG